MSTGFRTEHGRKYISTSRGTLSLGLYKHKSGYLYLVVGTSECADNENSYGLILQVDYYNSSGDKFTRQWAEFFEKVEWPDGVTRARFCPCREDGSLL